MKNSTKTILTLRLFVFLLAILFATGCKQVPDEFASSDKYRLVWNTDPTTSITLAWDQLQKSEVEVCFGTKDWGRKYWKYKQKAAPTESNNKYGYVLTAFLTISYFAYFLGGKSVLKADITVRKLCQRL